jgi:hypothetical protein
VDGVVVDGVVDGVVDEPPLSPPMFGQSPAACVPPLAANIACGPAYAGVELVLLDPDPPAAIATVVQTAAATITARIANQRLGRVELVLVMHTSFLELLVDGRREERRRAKPGGRSSEPRKRLL